MKTAWGCGAVMFLQYFLWFGNQSVGIFVMAATETPCHDCRVRTPSTHCNEALLGRYPASLVEKWDKKSIKRCSRLQNFIRSACAKFTYDECHSPSLSLFLTPSSHAYAFIKKWWLYHLYLRVAGGAVNQEALHWVVQDLPWETSLPSLQSWFVFSTLVSTCKDSRMLPVTVSRLH